MTAAATPEEHGLACQLCGEPRTTTPHTQGVWTTCDECGSDWWCTVGERDELDEPLTWICSGGCDDGWDCDCSDDEDGGS